MVLEEFAGSKKKRPKVIEQQRKQRVLSVLFVYVRNVYIFCAHIVYCRKTKDGD